MKSTRVKNGFGLIEVMVVGGLLSAVFLVISQITVSGSKAQSSIQAQTDITNLSHLISLVFADPNGCINNFNNDAFDPTPLPGTSVPVTTIPPKLVYLDNTTIVGPVGTTWGGLTIKKIQLIVTAVGVPNSSYGASIHLEASSQSALGDSTFSQDIPINLAVVPDAIAPKVDIKACSSMTLGRVTCPPPSGTVTSWTMLGPGGTSETYCISNAQAAGANWAGAQTACGQAGAHLCTPSEFEYACSKNPAFVAPPVWVDAFNGNDGGGTTFAVTMAAGGTCSGVAGSDFSAPAAYRCCMR